MAVIWCWWILNLVYHFWILEFAECGGLQRCAADPQFSRPDGHGFIFGTVRGMLTTWSEFLMAGLAEEWQPDPSLLRQAALIAAAFQFLTALGLIWTEVRTCNSKVYELAEKQLLRKIAQLFDERSEILARIGDLKTKVIELEALLTEMRKENPKELQNIRLQIAEKSTALKSAMKTERRKNKKKTIQDQAEDMGMMHRENKITLHATLCPVAQCWREEIQKEVKISEVEKVEEELKPSEQELAEEEQQQKPEELIHVDDDQCGSVAGLLETKIDAIHDETWMMIQEILQIEVPSLQKEVQEEVELSKVEKMEEELKTFKQEIEASDCHQEKAESLQEIQELAEEDQQQELEEAVHVLEKDQDCSVNGLLKAKIDAIHDETWMMIQETLQIEVPPLQEEVREEVELSRVEKVEEELKTSEQDIEASKYHLEKTESLQEIQNQELAEEDQQQELEETIHVLENDQGCSENSQPDPEIQAVQDEIWALIQKCQQSEVASQEEEVQEEVELSKMEKVEEELKTSEQDVQASECHQDKTESLQEIQNQELAEEDQQQELEEQSHVLDGDHGCSENGQKAAEIQAIKDEIWALIQKCQQNEVAAQENQRQETCETEEKTPELEEQSHILEDDQGCTENSQLEPEIQAIQDEIWAQIRKCQQNEVASQEKQSQQTCPAREETQDPEEQSHVLEGDHGRNENGHQTAEIQAIQDEIWALIRKGQENEAARRKAEIQAIQDEVWALILKCQENEAAAQENQSQETKEQKQGPEEQSHVLEGDHSCNENGHQAAEIQAIQDEIWALICKGQENEAARRKAEIQAIQDEVWALVLKCQENEAAAQEKQT